MIDPKAFANGMGQLAAAFSGELTKERMSVYLGVLSPKLSDAQWEQAVRRALESETFFPPPAVLLRYGVSDGALAARAGEAHEKIVRHYEKGDRIGYRQIMELYGHAAAEGFMAAGGAARFEWCEPDSVPFRLKDFAAAFLEVAEVDPVGALKGGEDARLLEEREGVRGLRGDSQSESETGRGGSDGLSHAALGIGAGPAKGRTA